MPKMEEHKPSTAATQYEKILVDKLHSLVGSSHLTDWENTFISSIKAHKDNDFVLLLSGAQRKILIRIWEKLYDSGVIV